MDRNIHSHSIDMESSRKPILSHTSDNLLPVFLLRFDRPHTRRAYRNDLVHFFDSECITPEMVNEVTFVHVNAYIMQLERMGFKAATIQRRLAALRSFFGWLQSLEIIERNPTDRHLVRRVRSVHRTERPIVFLSREEAKKLLEATRHAGKAALRNRALILTLLHCVLRRSEAAAMDVEHIRQLGPYWILDIPESKGGSDQFVKIPPHVVEAIEEMKAHYGIQAGALWRSLSNNSYGRRLSASSIYEIVKKTAIYAGISKRIGAHTLRHTGCTLAIESGALLHQVQAHARHKNIRTTMIYVHQRDKLRDSAADFIRIVDKE